MHGLGVEVKGLATFGSELRIRTILSSLAVLVHDEWLDQGHDRLVEGIEHPKLARSTHVLSHLSV